MLRGGKPVPSVLETRCQKVLTKLSAIKGDTSYHYGADLRAVEMETIEADRADFFVNSLAAPRILIQLGDNVKAAGEDTLDEWTREQEFRILFKLQLPLRTADTNAAIEDMTRALFSPTSDVDREPGWAIVREDPETRARLPGVLLIFSTVYSERIGDPTTGT